MSIAKFLRTAFFVEHLWWLLLKIKSILKEFSLERHLGENSRFYYEKSRCILKGRDFIMNGREFHDGRPKLHYERSRFLWWQPDVLLWTVKLFMMTDREFCDNWSKCYYERSRFSRWWVEIFMMAAWDFYDILRFLWKQVKIFNDSAKSRRVRGTSHQPALMVYFQICSHMSWSIHPGNGIIFRFRWCPVQEGCWCGFNKK